MFSGVQGFSPPHVCDEVRQAVADERLYRCLRCDAVLEQRLEPAWLRRGGYLHQLATSQQGPLASSRQYRFPLQVGAAAAAAEPLLRALPGARVAGRGWGTSRLIPVRAEMYVLRNSG